MRLHSGSFLLGLGAAALLPLLMRYFRPFVVEATAAGIAAFEEVRRVMAEQVEVIQDIAAEAKVRRAAGLGIEPEAPSDDRRRAAKARTSAPRRPLDEVQPAVESS